MTDRPVEPTLEEAELSQKEPSSLLQRVLKGGALTLGGHFASQVIRLASNLILSRLLFPEAFGLMALVYTFITGLHLFSDTGTNANIIQSKRGDDRTFINTAWTVDCIRGVILWIAACIISIPVANFYNEPIVRYLLPVTALSTLIGGFSSNKVVIANRNLQVGRLMMIDLIVQIVGVGITLIGAWIAKSMNAPRDVAVWALVAGNLAGTICGFVLSFTAFEGENDRFQLDRESLHELFTFGRWIFLSTLITFFALQGNNLVIPRLMGVGFFGVYSFASGLSQSAKAIVDALGSRVLFPSFSELYRNNPERVYSALRRSRFALNGVNCVVALGFVIFGKQLIAIMYDARYVDAGWMLQILALGSMVNMLLTTYDVAVMSQGKTKIMLYLMIIQVITQFIGILVGYHVGKEFGLVLGSALAYWALYPFQAIIYARLSLWQPEVDFPFLAFATVIAAVILIH